MRAMHIHRRRFCASLLAGGGGLIMAIAAPVAWAHRAKEALTTIEWNERSPSLEVIHRLHAHDAQTAVANVMDVHPPDLTEIKPRAALALYVERRFAVSRGGEPEVMATIGAELEGDYVFVYQELSLDAPPEMLFISNTILLDIYRTQTNMVNVRIGGPVRTAVFSAGHTHEAIELPPP